MKQKQFLVLLLFFPSITNTWAEPAIARAPITANVTAWSEDPCKYGDQYRDACSFAIKHQLFTYNSPTTEKTLSNNTLTTNNLPQTTTVEYGNVQIQTTVTSYE